MFNVSQYGQQFECRVDDRLGVGWTLEEHATHGHVLVADRFNLNIENKQQKMKT